LVDTWLDSNDYRINKSGLLLLERMATEPGYENSPAIFRRTTPLFRHTPNELRSAVSSLLKQLAKRFPQETTFILTESLTASDHPDTYFLVRQVLYLLPSESRKSIHRILQEEKRQPPH
jgi:hypothetical protein